MSVELIEKFYTAFNNLDAETMAECYHEDVRFSDPAFGQLKGERASNMWRMLCESQQGKDFLVEHSQVRMEGETGKAHWEAHYNFSQTGRRVHNIIEATFRFKDGKIIRHDDVFNVYRWSKQALGTTGLIMGWTPFFRNRLNLQTNILLTKWEGKKKELRS